MLLPFENHDVRLCILFDVWIKDEVFLEGAASWAVEGPPSKRRKRNSSHEVVAERARAETIEE